MRLVRQEEIKQISGGDEIPVIIEMSVNTFDVDIADAFASFIGTVVLFSDAGAIGINIMQNAHYFDIIGFDQTTVGDYIIVKIPF